MPLTDAGETPAPRKRAKRPKRAKEKVDPALVAKVRELRDRCLERVNGAGVAGLLSNAGEYDVSRPMLIAQPVAMAPAQLPAPTLSSTRAA